MEKIIRSSVVVEQLAKVLKKKTRYVWGAHGQKLTESFVKNQIKIHEKWYNENNRGTDLLMELKRGELNDAFGFDCSGLVLAVSAYGWKEDGTFISENNIKFDTTANKIKDMFESPINIAESTKEWYNKNLVPGMALWMDGHIGIFVGDGKIVEATTKGNKVMCVGPDYRKNNWKIAGKLPWVAYGNVSTKKTDVPKTASAQSVASAKSDLKKNTNLQKALRMLWGFEDMDLYKAISTEINNADYKGAKAKQVGDYTPLGFGNLYNNTSYPYVSNGKSSYYKENRAKFVLGEYLVYDPKTKRTPMKQAMELSEVEFFIYIDAFLSSLEKNYGSKVDLSKMTDYELGAAASLFYLTGSGILTSKGDFNKSWTSAFIAHQNAKRTNGDVKGTLAKLSEVWMTNKHAGTNRKKTEIAFYSTGTIDVDLTIPASSGTTSSGSSSTGTSSSYYKETVEAGSYAVNNTWVYAEEEEEFVPNLLDDGESDNTVYVTIEEDEIPDNEYEEIAPPIYEEHKNENLNKTDGVDVVLEEAKKVEEKAKEKAEEFEKVNSDGSVSKVVTGNLNKDFTDVSVLAKNMVNKVVEITESQIVMEQIELAIPTIGTEKVSIPLVGETKKNDAFEELIEAKIVNTGKGESYVVYGTSLFNLFESYLSYVDEHFIWEGNLKTKIYDKYLETEFFTKDMGDRVYVELFMILIDPILERFKTAEAGEVYDNSMAWSIWQTQIFNKVMYDGVQVNLPLEFSIDGRNFSEEKIEAARRFSAEFMYASTHMEYVNKFGFGFEMRDQYKRVITPYSIYAVLFNMAGMIFHLWKRKDEDKYKMFFEQNKGEKLLFENKVKAAENNAANGIEKYLNDIAKQEKDSYKAEIDKLKKKFGIGMPKQNVGFEQSKEFANFWNLVIFLIIYFYLKNTKRFESIFNIYNKTDYKKKESILGSYDAFKDYIISEEIKLGLNKQNFEFENRFEEIAEKYKETYKNISYKILFIKVAKWNTADNKIFSWADDFFRFFATGYNYSTRDSKSIASQLVSDIPFDKMQSVAKSIREDMAYGTQFISEILNVVFVEMGILKNLSTLSRDLDELGSAFDLIKPKLFPKTPPTLKGASIRALSGVVANTSIVLAVNFLLNKKMGKLGLTPLELYENVVTVDNVAKSLDSGAGKQKILNSVFSVENDVFYKKAKNVGFGLYSLTRNLSIYENTKKFLDFNFSDDYLEIVSKKLSVDINVLKTGNHTVEAKFPLFFTFSNYLQYKYRLKNNSETVFSSSNIFNSEYRNVSIDEFKIFLYTYYMKSSSGSYGVDSKGILNAINEFDIFDKNKNGTVIDLEVDRSWTDDLTVISRALYNYPEIEVYKLAIDYKKDSKDFAERERILNFYLEDGKNRAGIDDMLTQKRQEILDGLSYFYKNRKIFETSAKEYIKSKRAVCSILDGYSKIEPSVDIVLDFIGFQDKESSVKISDLTGKIVKGMDSFMETFIQPALKRQMEQMENLNMVMNFNEKEIKKYGEFEAIKEIAKYLKTSVSLIEDILNNSKKYQTKWFL